MTTFKPLAQDVILDPSTVGDTALNAHIWNNADFEDDEDEEEEDKDEEPTKTKTTEDRAIQALEKIHRNQVRSNQVQSNKENDVKRTKPPEPQRPKPDRTTNASDNNPSAPLNPNKLPPTNPKKPVSNIKPDEIRSENAGSIQSAP